VSAETLRRALGRADGEVVDWDELFGTSDRSGAIKQSAVGKASVPRRAESSPPKASDVPPAKKEPAPPEPKKE
jgi:hypothetical protein